MTVIGALLAAAAWLAVTVIGYIVADLISEEARSRLDVLPYALLRFAALRLPVELREDRLAEWTGELREILRSAEVRPVTRLVRGTHYAAGVGWAASSISRTVAATRTTTPRQPAVTSWNVPTRLARRSLGVIVDYLAVGLIGSIAFGVICGIVSGFADGGFVAGSVLGFVYSVFSTLVNWRRDVQGSRYRIYSDNVQPYRPIPARGDLPWPL